MPQPLPEKRKIVWSDDKYYFLTNSTYLHYPYFKQPDQKQIVLNSIKKLQSKYSIPVQDFSIAINHSHLMFYADKGKKVSFVKRFLKNNVSREYRESYQRRGPTGERRKDVFRVQAGGHERWGNGRSSRHINERDKT